MLDDPIATSTRGATHKMERPRGWNLPIPIGRYWRSALVVYFNYGVDTGTVGKSAPFHAPILWRHVSWGRQSPDREVKERSHGGWLFYRRVKTDKTYFRPMNRVVHAHIKSIMPENPPAHVLAYNLIRTIMAQAASNLDIQPRSMSFEGAVQTLDAFQPVIALPTLPPE